uniref:Cd8 beta n=1 Tax=Gasterosteus aculeatus aculeatus TaxID=481459 RepID=A0AAQ4PLR6_GASAC
MYPQNPSAAFQDTQTRTHIGDQRKMSALPLAWTLLTVSLTSGWSQILQQDTVKIQYPVLHSTEVIECDCGNVLCDNVYWFRSIHNHEKLEFLGRFNNAGRGSPVDEAHFKLSRKSNTCFALFIINVTEEDTGIYSCVLKDRKNTETWKSGILLRPGVTAPTLPPHTKPKPPVEPVCGCPTKDPSQGDCGSLVLWPLVGLVAALALALIGTLYYFSRE